MATSSVKDCSICNEEFNEEDRCPRNLPCSHCFCTHCIGQLIIKNNKKCPFCRQNFQARSATDFKINTTTLDLVKYIKTMETKPEASGKESTKSRSQMMSDLKKSSYESCSRTVASLKSSEDRIQKAIDDNEELKRKLLDYQAGIQKDVILKLNVLQDECNARVAYIDARNERLKEQLEHLRERQKKYVVFKTKIDAATKFAQLDEVIDEADAFNKAAVKWLQIFQMSFQNGEKNQLMIQTKTKKLEERLAALMNVLNTLGRTDDQITEQIRNTALQLSSKLKLNASNLKKMSGLLRVVSVYAVQQFNGKSRWAKLTMSENKMLLHCLSEGPIPNSKYILQHGEVLTLVDSSSRLVFLELGVNGYSLGKMFIRLTPNTKRAQNFSVLCTGEKGPSYVNSHLMRLKYKGSDNEHIVAGDYEYNNGKGGKAVVEESGKEAVQMSKQDALAGLVFGLINLDNATAAQFGIHTRKTGTLMNQTFGYVESGLHILTTAISTYPDITDVKIIDSGIVLNVQYN